MLLLHVDLSWMISSMAEYIISEDLLVILNTFKAFLELDHWPKHLR